MARMARQVSGSGAYHIVLRSNNKLLFVEASDYRKFIDLLQTVSARDLLEVCAYCLFSEAVHLVVKEGLTSVSQSMKHLISGYALWCNAKYDRGGKLFFDRFLSEALESDSDLLDAVRYCHQLPASRGSDVNYEYSSYNNYIKRQGLRSDAVMLLLSSSVFEFRDYMGSMIEREFLSDISRPKLSDAELGLKIRELLGDTQPDELDGISPYEFRLLVRRFKKIEGASIRQLARVLGLSKSFVERA